jgi:hypothetical protein
MATDLPMGPQLEQIHGEIRDNFRALAYVPIISSLSLLAKSFFFYKYFHFLIYMYIGLRGYCNVRAVAMVFVILNLCDLACML